MVYVETATIVGHLYALCSDILVPEFMTDEGSGQHYEMT